MSSTKIVSAEGGEGNWEYPKPEIDKAIGMYHRK